MLDDYLLKSWILTKHIHQNVSNFKFIEHINEDQLNSIKKLSFKPSNFPRCFNGYSAKMTSLNELNIIKPVCLTYHSSSLKYLNHLTELELVNAEKLKIDQSIISVFENLKAVKVYFDFDEINLFSNFLLLEKIQFYFISKTFDSNHFINLKKLSILNIEESIIETLQSKMFEHLFNLKELSIVKSELTSLVPGCFEGLKNLEKIFLSKNKIKKISKDIFKGLEKLSILDLQCNKIEFIEDFAFIHLSSLIYLNLKENCLKLITKNVFSGLKNLKKIKLSGNRIELIEYESFSHLNKVKLLDLKENNLKKINKNIFTSVKDFNILNLNANSEKTKTNGFLRHYKNEIKKISNCTLM